MGVVGERSEPPAGGLAVGAEGSVNSELTVKIPRKRMSKMKENKSTNKDEKLVS